MNGHHTNMVPVVSWWLGRCVPAQTRCVCFSMQLGMLYTVTFFNTYAKEVSQQLISHAYPHQHTETMLSGTYSCMCMQWSAGKIREAHAGCSNHLSKTGVALVHREYDSAMLCSKSSTMLPPCSVSLLDQPSVPAPKADCKTDRPTWTITATVADEQQQRHWLC